MSGLSLINVVLTRPEKKGKKGRTYGILNPLKIQDTKLGTQPYDIGSVVFDSTHRVIQADEMSEASEFSKGGQISRGSKSIVCQKQGFQGRKRGSQIQVDPSNAIICTEEGS